MKLLFSFFLRLFISFVAAKLFLRAVGADTLGYLMGLTLILVGNIYWFDLLHYRECRYHRGQAQENPVSPGNQEAAPGSAGEASSASAPPVPEP